MHLTTEWVGQILALGSLRSKLHFAGDTLTEDTTNNVHRMYLRIGGVNAPRGSNFINSVEAKYVSCPWIMLQNERGNHYFNIQTGTLGTIGGGAMGPIEALEDGWYRCGVAGYNCNWGWATLVGRLYGCREWQCHLSWYFTQCPAPQSKH